MERPAEIVSCNDPCKLSTRSRISYLVRFLFCILTMESVLHTMYVVAIKDTSAWHGDSAADLSMIGFWNLVVVWLKVSHLRTWTRPIADRSQLLVPWRFFRLWALWDGVDPPENMIRCVANNFSTLGLASEAGTEAIIWGHQVRVPRVGTIVTR